MLLPNFCQFPTDQTFTSAASPTMRIAGPQQQLTPVRVGVCSVLEEQKEDGTDIPPFPSSSVWENPTPLPQAGALAREGLLGF